MCDQKKKKKTYKLSYLRKKIYVLLNFFKKKGRHREQKVKRVWQTGE